MSHHQSYFIVKISIYASTVCSQNYFYCWVSVTVGWATATIQILTVRYYVSCFIIQTYVRSILNEQYKRNNAKLRKKEPLLLESPILFIFIKCRKQVMYVK